MEAKDGFMPQINFYHLTATPLEKALPKLLEKASSAGFRVVVKVGDAAMLANLDKALWTYDPNSFLAHGTDETGNAEDQPIYLTLADDNPNNAKLLAVTDGSSPALDGYDRVLDLFDAADETAVANARTRWKAYKDAGLDLQYWQQTEQGGWQQKA